MKTTAPIASRGDYLLSRNGDCDYGEISDLVEIEAYAAFGGRRFNSPTAGRKGTYLQSISRQNERGGVAEKWFRVTISNFGKPIERKLNSDGRQARL